VIEATNSPLGFRDAVRASRIEGRVVLAGIPEARRGLKIKFVRRMGDNYPRAIELVTSGRVDVRALVTHCERLDAAPELFEALALGRPGYEVISGRRRPIRWGRRAPSQSPGARVKGRRTMEAAAGVCRTAEGVLSRP
jgi:hypothetical protein